MKRSLAALAVLALAVGAPAGVLAKNGPKPKKPTPRAKVLKATIGPVGTDAGYAGIEGKAQLVDGKRNDKVSIHVRGLRPGTTYPWHVHAVAADAPNPCAQGAPQGPIVTAFTYRALTADASGNANSNARSRTFTVDSTKKYYVNVHSPTTFEPIACGVLKGKKAKKAKKHSKSHSKSHGRRGHTHGKKAPRKARKRS
jgi:hypothetical protein